MYCSVNLPNIITFYIYNLFHKQSYYIAKSIMGYSLKNIDVHIHEEQLLAHAGVWFQLSE